MIRWDSCEFLSLQTYCLCLCQLPEVDGLITFDHILALFYPGSQQVGYICTVSNGDIGVGVLISKKKFLTLPHKTEQIVVTAKKIEEIKKIYLDRQLFNIWVVLHFLSYLYKNILTRIYIGWHVFMILLDIWFVCHIELSSSQVKKLFIYVSKIFRLSFFCIKLVYTIQ